MATLQTLPDATTVLPQQPSGGVTTVAVRGVFYAVFKHGRLVIGVFLLIFLAAAVTAVVRPTTWQASTKVLVKLGEQAQLAPAETLSKSFYLPLTPEVIKTESDIIRSLEVIKDAVGRVGVQPEPGTSFAEMLNGMQLALTVTPSPGSNVLQVSYIGRSPERSARMVNAITDAYVDHHHRVYNTEGTALFYNKHVHVLHKELKATQHRLRRFQKRHRIIDVDQEILLLDKDVLDQKKSFAAFRLKMRGVAEKIASVRAQIDRTPEQIRYSEDYHANATLESFRTRLAQLEAERLGLLQAFLPTDRHVTDKDEEIAALKARMGHEQERLLTDQTNRHNELRQELQKNAFTLETLLSDLRAREPGLRQRLAETAGRLRSLRDAHFTVVNMKADADEKAYAYDLFRKKEEEARVQEAMTFQSMVSVSVVDHAVPPLQPQNGLLLPLLLGLAGGLALAVGVAVAVEYLNRRLRFEEEVERYLELPVLAVIPELESTTAIARA
jgi:succinoglycan biosynthesis transport protein ExoP